MEKDLYGLSPIQSATPKIEETQQIKDHSSNQVPFTDTKSTK